MDREGPVELRLLRQIGQAPAAGQRDVAIQRVDLPAPLGPTMAVRLPVAISPER